VLCKTRAESTCKDDEHLAGLVAAIDRMNEQYEPVADDEEMVRINR